VAAGAVSVNDDIITTLLAVHRMAQSRRQCGDDDATVENLQLFCGVDAGPVTTLHQMKAVLMREQLRRGDML
jgi:hypothetical protein